MLQRNSQFVADRVQNFQAYDIAERIDTAESPAAVIVCEAGFKEPGAIPIAELPDAYAGQALNVFLAERGYDVACTHRVLTLPLVCRLVNRQYSEHAANARRSAPIGPITGI